MASLYVLHCKETIPTNLKQIFPEKELCGHSPNFHIHESVSDLDPHNWSAFSAAGKYVDRS